MRIGKAMLFLVLGLLLLSSIGCGGCAGEDGADGANGQDGQDLTDDDTGDDDVDDDTTDDDTTDDDTTDDDTTDDDTTDDDTTDDDTTDDDTTDDDTTDDDTTDDDTTDDDTTDDDTTDDDTGDDDTGSPYEFDGATEIFGVEINDVVTAATTTVYFAVADANGDPVTNMAASALRLGIAKLTAPGAGLSGQWVSYINQTESKDAGEPGTTPDGTTANQATTQTCNASGGVFANYGDGTYSYTFNFDITNVTTPIAVSYDPALVHRVAMQYSGNAYNAVYDFIPNGGSVTNARKIVSEASCNECHTKLALHGGSRLQTDYCVVCHNPGTTDANSGNVVDLATMVHKIHAGAELTNDYTIWGHNNSENNYNEVEYPGDLHNCEKCHTGADAATPQGDNWKLFPRRSACGACHDTVDFSSHYGNQTTDENCLLCHDTDGIQPIEESHINPSRVWTDKFEYHIISVTNTAPGEYPVVTFSVTNPSDGDSFWDIKSGVNEWNGSASLNVKIADSTTDYQNLSNGPSLDAQPVSMNGKTASVDNLDGTYTVTFTTPISEDAVGSGVVFIDGRPSADFDGDSNFTDRAVVRNVHTFFKITDSTVKPRRDVVTIERCDQCHDLLSLHGSNRNDDIGTCVTCHNPRATDISKRSGIGVDGLAARSINFKYMIHGIHAGEMRENPLVVYGYGGSVNDFSGVVFPGHLAKCTMCHEGDTYGLPLPSGVLSNTMDPGSVGGVEDDEVIQATMAACYACHDDDTTEAHMVQMGGIAGPETCVLCHGEGKDYDVYAVHE